MNRDLQRYLDGELPLADVPPELRRQAEEWDELLAAAAELSEERAPTWLEGRVMASLPDGPPLPLWRRILRWMLEPQPVRVRPLSAALATGALVLLLVWLPPAPPATPQPVAAAGTEDAGTTIYVQFAYRAPDARSVSVAGSFNGWDPAGALLRDPDGDGVWTGTVPLAPGVHKYMFVVDGEEWVTDPRAERYVDDGFGMRNALLAVSTPTRRAS